MKLIARGLALSVAAFTLTAQPAVAQDQALQAAFGKQIFRVFCVGCHGAGGKGDGDVAEAFDVRLRDLTQIAKENDGTFPKAEIAAAIAGTSPVRGHRALVATEWTEMFAAEFEKFAAEMAVNQLVARRIEHLLAYLESIQELDD